MVFESSEIRWFTENPKKDIENWFNRYSSLVDKDDRTDIYLRAGIQNNMGIKIREGRFEVKAETGKSELFDLSENIHGKLEHYKKWSFPTSEEYVAGSSDWIEVEKSRKAVIITGEPGNYSILSKSTRLEKGCQFEYCRLKVNNKAFYTFGFEAFGGFAIPKNDGLVRDIFVNSALDSVHSMGYVEFLRNNLLS